MPRAAVSNDAWFTAKQDNFLCFLLELCDKYETEIPQLGAIKIYTKDLQKDDMKRGIMFSGLARKNIVDSVPVFHEAVKSAKSLWERPKEEKCLGYEEAVKHLEDIHSKFGAFICYLKDNEAEILPDLDKLAGYTALFYGDFIKTT